MVATVQLKHGTTSPLLVGGVPAVTSDCCCQPNNTSCCGTPPNNPIIIPSKVHVVISGISVNTRTVCGVEFSAIYNQTFALLHKGTSFGGCDGWALGRGGTPNSIESCPAIGGFVGFADIEADLFCDHWEVTCQWRPAGNNSVGEFDYHPFGGHPMSPSSFPVIGGVINPRGTFTLPLLSATIPGGAADTIYTYPSTITLIAA